jgi:Ala-tRNA(Pro) deacylase
MLAVVRDDQHVPLSTRDSYATMETVEELTGCAVGTLAPFSFRSDLVLVMDRDLLMAQEILFPAARPDVSIALNTSDYLRFAAPRVACIAQTSFAEAA